MPSRDGAAWKDRLARLWQPPVGIGAETARQRARIALAILFALTVLALLDVVVALAGVYGDGARGSWNGAVAFAGLGMAYVLARTGRVTAGVLLAILLVEASLWWLRISAGTGPEHVTFLYFLAVPILVAALLLPARPAALVAGATIVAALAGEAVLHGGGAGLGVEAVGLVMMLLAVSVVSMTAAWLNGRDARLLHENRQMLRELAENIPEVFFVVAPDLSRSYYASPAYEEIWGRRAGQAMADPLDWLQGVHPEDLPRVRASLLDPPREGLEFRVVHPSGVVRHVRSRIFPVVGDRGEVVRLVGVAEDITEARRSQELLREAQAQRIRLLQQLAHDLASPLSPVKIQLRLLRERVAPEGRPSLAVVERNVDHVQRLVADVQDLARLEGGGLRLDPKPIDLAVLARQAVETIAPSADERQVQVAVEAPARLDAEGDPGRVTQVIYNLVGNALKFTPAGGRVDVRVARLDGRAQVSVQDSGAGMRPDQVERLFRPFSQVHDPGTVQRPEDKGTGLDLYISKGIVEAHGGRIEAQSDGAGRGATFTFWLPLPIPAHGPG